MSVTANPKFIFLTDINFRLSDKSISISFCPLLQCSRAVGFTTNSNGFNISRGSTGFCFIFGKKRLHQTRNVCKRMQISNSKWAIYSLVDTIIALRRGPFRFRKFIPEKKPLSCTIKYDKLGSSPLLHLTGHDENQF